MTIVVFAFNQEGSKLAAKLAAGLDHNVVIKEDREAKPLKQTVADVWHQADGLIFIGAAGLVVRIIAPLLESKVVDPAVLVIDARGQFVISLLSGHLGGANRLARQVARVLEATPVVTTATDVLGKTSVEEWAEAFGLKVANPAGLVAINKALVRDEPITVYTELSPELYQEPVLNPGKTRFKTLAELSNGRSATPSLAITRQELGQSMVDLELVVPSLTVGIGCRRGTDKEVIRQLILSVFKENNWPLAAIKQLVSVTHKENEEGLLALARELKVPVHFYQPRELQTVLEAMPHLEKSAFVEKKIGVGAVCEPAAILGSNWGQLLVGKRACQGVTVAVARAELS